MAKGVVIGKFYPLHAGHQYVIDTALSMIDFLTIIVTGKQGQIVKPEVRGKWIRKIYPGVRVKVIYHNIPDDDDEAWAKHTLEWLGYKPDFVFTSENYGDHYASLMKSKHIPVDIPRKKFPISGTAIREDPLSYFDYLHPVVRAYFVRRICFVGAESVGKTTLAQMLAKKFKTSWVPEFGRLYTEGKVNSKYSNWEVGENEFIAVVQNSIEDELAKRANKVLFCDTDVLTSYVWDELLLGIGFFDIEKILRKRRYDLYIVADTDIGFVPDDVRMAKKKRDWMHKRFLELLVKYKLKHIIISGPLKKRLETCEKLVNEIIKNFRVDEKIL